MTVETNRLRLIPCTFDLLEAEGADRARFAELLGATVPPEWPPELYDDDARRWTLNKLKSDPLFDGWAIWYAVVRETGILIGMVGFKGPPDQRGVVEVGYGILPPHQRNGYASEATAALISRAFALPEVTAVAAETYPHLTASLGVMRKNGMTYVGPGSEDGVVRYQVIRSYQQRP